MFSNVIGDRVDATDNGSEWDSLLVWRPQGKVCGRRSSQ